MNEEEIEKTIKEVNISLDNLVGDFKWVFDLFFDFIETPGTEIDLEELRRVYRKYWVL